MNSSKGNFREICTCDQHKSSLLYDRDRKRYRPTGNCGECRLCFLIHKELDTSKQEAKREDYIKRIRQNCRKQKTLDEYGS